MKRLKNIGDRGLQAAFILFLAFLWEFISIKLKVPNYILPAPSRILKALFVKKQILWEHTKTTFFEAMLGFLIAIVLAVILGQLMNCFKKLKVVLYPILLISQTVPLIAIAPLILIWFGFGVIPKIIIVIIVCFFPILISFLDGMEQVDEDMVHLMKTMKASTVQIFFKLKVPASLPAFFAGLKISATYSIMGAVIGEWLGAKNGLGIFMTRAISSFKTDELFADILIVVALSFFMFKLVKIFEIILMPYNKNSRNGGK